ncbi:probable LRR receptor-like serine/threonine-protein kinase At3g47570 [Capsicum annuum]|uniref:probable LRR receptor-like serine/threonine-protein kinase At3g47570 n=1 Tax=Capsicum annuum TaxID=4072 RepID=UPI001FB0DC21|nr:probable LRR receptor-like serine/threonine-protein kinase At3g47570 [Capsicum annuum]
MEKAFTSFLLTSLLLHYVMASSAMTKTNITTDQLALFTLKSQIVSDPFHFLDESSSFATSGQIPKVIGNLRELKLRGNNLIGSIPLSLSNASRLETLDISYNSLQRNIPEEIGNLHNMKVLSIQDNQITGSIPFIIFNISRIEVIAFSGNSLSGYLPYGLCNGLPTLKGLYLWKNKLCDHMPTGLSNCSQLQILALPDNEFGGPMHSEFGRLINLQILELGMNRIIPQEIENLVNLVELAMEKNQITGSVPISIFNISLFFGGSLPMESFNISGLRVIDLTNNNLSGSLPPNMGSILPNIEELYMDNLTNLVGTIPHSISNCSKLTILEFLRNKLIGLIPNSLGYLTHLQYLNLGGNNLTRDSSLSFLTSLANCRKSTTLALYLNPLNGILPASAGNLSTSLRTFVAYSCKIKGRIPNEFGNLSSLLDLDLSANSLAGSIPPTIGNLRNLQRFNLSNNKLKGFIGDDICKLQHLGDIYLGRNQFSGSLPNCLGNITILREIHLGSNKLSSNIPPSLGNILDLVVFDLSSNNMAGSLTLEIGNLMAVTLIDLSMNKFSNRIPREIGGLQNLAHLYLRHNKLQGAIPDSMSNTVGLEFLDLSQNNVSGIILKSLEKLQNLKYFNVSFDKLYGETPSGGPLKNLSSQFFIYNEALCGSSRFGVPPCPTSSKHRSNRKKVLVVFLLLGIALVFVPSIFVFLWISDSNRIGSGSFGSVYKGVLRSGTAIAFKVFNLQLDAPFKSFDTEFEVLCSLRHRIIS